MLDGMAAEARRMQGVAGYEPSIGPLCAVCGEMVLDVWPSRYGEALPVHEHCALSLCTERPVVAAVSPPAPEARPIARYVALGWRMVPIWPMRSGKCACGNVDCRHSGKHPIRRLAPNGVKAASADPATLKRWKAAVPDLNWAVATGPASGILVIDVDGPVGDQALADLEARHGALPPAPWQTTGGGRGGRQLFFSYPVARTVRNSAGVLRPKIDVRGASGYCVIPPSITREPYRWQIPPWGLPAPALPAAWIELLDPPAPAPAPRPAWSAPSGQQPGRPRYARKAFESELALVACAPAGRRNDQLNASAYAVFRFVAEGKMSAATAADGLLAAAVHAGLTRREALGTISSAAKARGVHRG